MIYTKYLVIEDYTCQYTEPIKLKKNERVKVGQKFTEDPDWQGWIWCANQRGEKGWVLERILKIDYDIGIVLEDYDATELSAGKGEIVESIKTEGGWNRCRNSENEIGWLPGKNLKLYTGE